MLIDIFSLLLYQVLAFVLLAAVGKLLLYLFQIQITGQYKKAFFELLASMLSIAFFTALYYTSGKTVMLFLCLPIGIILYIYHTTKVFKKQRPYLTIYTQVWASVLTVSLLISVFTYFTLYTGNGYINPPNPDYVFNAKNSYFLAFFGLENISLEYFYREHLGVAPYHYFELWLNIFVFNLFQIPALNALLFIVFPIGLACVFLGFCALAETLDYLNYKTYLLSFSFLFFSGLYIFFYKYIYLMDTASAFTKNALIYPKLFSIYLCLQAFFILFYTQRYAIAYVFLLIIPILFISTIIGVLLAGGTYFLLNILFTKKERKLYINLLLAYILFAILIFSFYYFFRDNMNSQLTQASTFPTLDVLYFINIVKIFVTTGIRHIVLYLPILGIAGLAILKSVSIFKLLKNKYLLFCALLYIATLLSWAVLDKMPDAVQLFSNLTTPLISVNSFFMLIYFLKNEIVHKKIIYTFISITLLLNISMTYQELCNNEIHYTETYKKAIKEHIKNTNPIGAFIQNKHTKNIFVFSPDLYIPGQYLSLIGSVYHLVSLSVFDNYNASVKERVLLKNTSFYKFVESQKAINQFVSIDKSQIDFVKKYKIGYMIVAPGIQIEAQWNRLIDKEITDTKSGERFIILKKL